MEVTHNKSYIYAYLCGLPKYYQNEIWSNTIALNDKHFWHDSGWRLETNSRPFYDFIEMTI